MKLIRSIDKLHLSDSVVTIGNFDGIHLGHQHILKNLMENKKKYNLPAIVIIFEPQPLEYFLHKNAHARIMTIRQKLEKFSKYEIDYVVCLKFNAKFANMPAEQFVAQILITKLNVKHLIIGDDFTFGHNRSGDFTLLQTYADQNNVHLTRIETMRIAGLRISSSHIRKALTNSEFMTATKLLGHPYTMSGKIAHGDGRGHKLGFPTANIYLRHDVIPINGVFITKIWGIGNNFLMAIANIGQRPTFFGNRFVLEVHIIDFNSDIYGKRINIEFLHKIRDETKFSSGKQLIEQIKNDIRFTKEYRA